MENYEGLIIRKDKLFESFWVKPIHKDEECDEIIKEGYYDECEISDDLIYFLNDNCRIEDGTTLRDIFKLLEPHKDLLSIIERRNWFKEYLEYGLKCPVLDINTLYEEDGLNIDYLEVYFTIQNTHYNKKYDTSSFYSFHAISKPYTKKYCEKVKDNYGLTSEDVGQTTPIGFFGSDLNTLIDFPIKLCNETYLVKENFDNYKIENPEILKGFCSYSLMDIIHAIFFELSFNGSPEDSKKRKEELEDIVKDIKK